MKPAVSVFTTFYRDVKFLDECIASVLSQTFGDFEYLIINDGPLEIADRIEKRFTDPRIRIVTNATRVGLMRSRNAGLHEARADLIAFIDADDICVPDRLHTQVEFLRSHPDHVLVGSNIVFVDDQSRPIGQRLYPQHDLDIKKHLIARNCIAQPTVMARRHVLIDAGGYTPDFEWAEDYDLWLRAARFGKFHNLQEPVTRYRIHDESGKNLRLRRSLRDTARLQVFAMRRYGFKPTFAALRSIAVHTLLLLLPSRLIFWLFKKTTVTSSSEMP